MGGVKRFQQLSRDRPFYLIPIMMGMAGVLFSSQLEDPVQRGVVVLLCLAVPLFVGGNLLARIYSDGLQRWLLIAGMVSLTAGAVVTVSGLSDSLVDSDYVSKEVGELSGWMGMISLLLGLLVVLWSIVRSEALLDELGDRFVHVTDHMGEGFILLDPQGYVVLINKTLTELTGIDRKDIVGRRLVDLAARNDVHPVVDHADRRQRGLASNYETVWKREEGDIWFAVSESPLFDRRRKRVGTLITGRDITEEHRLRTQLEDYAQGLERLVEERTRELQRSEQRLRQLLLTMDEGFATLDGDLAIRFSNTRICEILGYSGEHLRGRKITDFVSLDGRERLSGQIQHPEQQEGHPGEHEYFFQREDGSSTPVKVSVAQLGTPEPGMKSEYSIVVTDVSEQKRMEAEIRQRAAELERANEELRELDRAKNVFLSNVSHELKTPLGTLDGYVDMLRSEELGPIEAPQVAALDVMARNIQRLTSMISEMIESSRMEIRGIRLVRELFDPARIAREACESVRPAAIRKSLSVSCNAPETLPFHWGDAPKISQTLDVLLSNAVKFTPEGGSITVIAKVDDGSLIFEVHDTGIGIPEAEHGRIFRKFYQVDSSMTRKFQGTGIGLSIAKAITEAHGGSVDIESREGVGSTFRLRLPGARFVAEGGDGVSLANRSILLAGTYPESMAAIHDALVDAGATVEMLESGHEVVRRAASDRPDVVLLDEAIEDLPIREVVHRFKGDPSLVSMALVTMWDRHGDHQSEEEREVAGKSRMLYKPFTSAQLVACMKSAIEEGAAVIAD